MEMISVALPILALMTDMIPMTACYETVLLFTIFCNLQIGNLKQTSALSPLQSMTQRRVRQINPTGSGTMRNNSTTGIWMTFVEISCCRPALLFLLLTLKCFL